MKGSTIFGLAILGITLFILGPFIAIWSLNTLFPALAIPYTFWTWLSALFLMGIVKSNVKVEK